MKDLAELRRLVLTGTSTSDAGCAHLAELTKLEELELCGTSISNDGLRSLRELQGLRRLGLDNTSIDDRGLAATSSALAAWELNMPKGVTELSAETYDLHMLIFWVCVIIGVLVFGAMFISLVKHRKSVGAEPAN